MRSDYDIVEIPLGFAVEPDGSERPLTDHEREIFRQLNKCFVWSFVEAKREIDEKILNPMWLVGTSTDGPQLVNWSEDWEVFPNNCGVSKSFLMSTTAHLGDAP